MDELRFVATHTNYPHRNHLRVEDGKRRMAWNTFEGWHEKDAISMAPSHSQYARLNRKGLPCYVCGTARTCRMCNG